ncbi:MAG: SprT family zinc-dependent metalloprotease [Gallionella sp.]|nr:SprT family zinc-dependent metalloprotease [Gallionella sp.]
MFKRLPPSAVTPPVTEQRTVLLAGRHIVYTLKRSHKRRSIGLRIDDRGLIVSMPKLASERWLSEVLQLRAAWLLEKLDERSAHKPQCWQDGQSIPYLGTTLMLRAVHVACPTHQGDQLWVQAEAIEQQVAAWYRQQAMQLFAARVAHYAAVLGVTPAALGLSTAKTLWGSCNSRGQIRLNVKLIKLPLCLIDYVVVHELAHLRQMNHSAAFWHVVKSVCPDYGRLRLELKGCRL